MPVGVQRESEANSLIRGSAARRSRSAGLSVDVVVFERAPDTLAFEAKGKGATPVERPAVEVKLFRLLGRERRAKPAAFLVDMISKLRKSRALQSSQLQVTLDGGRCDVAGHPRATLLPE